MFIDFIIINLIGFVTFNLLFVGLQSSIRHALYQKWFKKVRFQTDAINSKGCFWAINRKYNPKEWTMPGNDVGKVEVYATVHVMFLGFVLAG